MFGQLASLQMATGRVATLPSRASWGEACGLSCVQLRTAYRAELVAARELQPGPNPGGTAVGLVSRPGQRLSGPGLLSGSRSVGTSWYPHPRPATPSPRLRVFSRSELARGTRPCWDLSPRSREGGRGFPLGPGAGATASQDTAWSWGAGLQHRLSSCRRPSPRLARVQPACPPRHPLPTREGREHGAAGGGGSRHAPPFRGWDPGAWAEAPPLPGPRFPPLRLGIVTLGADTSHSAQAASEPGLPSGEQGRTQRPQAARRLQQQILPFGSWALQPKAGPLGRAGQGADSQALLGSRTGPRICVGRASGPSHPSYRAAAGPLRGEPL